MTPESPTTAARPEPFAGARKTGRWLFAGLEARLVSRWVGRVPACIGTQHLTLATLPWCALALAGGALASAGDWRWLSLVSLAIALQYLTDLFDGAVGRHRDTGLVRWGFYMDHLLDYVFLCSLFAAWAIALPSELLPWLLALLGVAGALMASSFLLFAATGEFRISHWGIGPSELRLMAIAANQALVACGPAGLARVLPAALAVAGVLLAAVAIRNGRALWALDLGPRR